MLIRLALVFLMTHALSLAGGAVRHLDYSEVDMPEKEKAVVIQLMPPEFEQRLVDMGTSPSAVNLQLAAQYYRKNSADTGGQDLLIYYLDCSHNGVLKVIRFIGDEWKLVTEASFAAGEAWGRITFADIDCDSANEIVLHSVTGASGYTVMNIVKYYDNTLRSLTPTTMSELLMGRSLSIEDSGAGCPKTIRILLDGPVKYQVDRRRTFRFDANTQRFVFISEERLESKDDRR